MMEHYGEIYCKHCGKLIEKGEPMIVFNDIIFDCVDCLINYVKQNTEYVINDEEYFDWTKKMFHFSSKRGI